MKLKRCLAKPRQHVLSISMVFVLLVCGVHRAYSDTTNIAVASNFMATAKQLAVAFEQTTGHTARLSFASTGKLYAQIYNGAPFDIFLAADQDRPALLENKGLAVANSRFTYAKGRIVLMPGATGVLEKQKRLSDYSKSDIIRMLSALTATEKVAIANPKIAPYGFAAIELIKSLGVYDDIKTHLVTAENVAQAYQFVATDNARWGVVALAQVLGDSTLYWPVPETLHSAINQDAVLLKKGVNKRAAQAFVAFLKGADARKIIEQQGYHTR